MDKFVEQAGAYLQYNRNCTSGPTVHDGKLDGITSEELHAEIDDYDEVINECKKHVLMHTAQREEFNRLVQVSKLSLQQGLPMELVTVLLVIDMAQSAATPCLSGDQMGNTSESFFPDLQYRKNEISNSSTLSNSIEWEISYPRSSYCNFCST